MMDHDLKQVPTAMSDWIQAVDVALRQIQKTAEGACHATAALQQQAPRIFDRIQVALRMIEHHRSDGRAVDDGLLVGLEALVGLVEDVLRGQP
jgi:hypothetical protein